MSDSFPETQDGLMAIIMNAESEQIERRIQAISRLGDQMADSKDPRGIFCLLNQIENSMEPKLITHCIGVLSRVKAYSSVSIIIDVALGIRIKLFEDNPSDYVHNDESLRLRCVAVQALGRMSDERAIVALMSLLNDKKENYRLRLVAAESLGKLGDAHAVTPLLDILADDREKSVYLKESAAKALGMLGDIRALEPMIDVLESKKGIRDKFNFLKEQLIEAIGRIGNNSSKASSSKATMSLVRVLRDESPSIRLAAVEALSNIGDPNTLDSLKELIFDKDDDVAMAAISAVYQIGGEPMIRDLLKQDNLPQFLRDELESYIP
ncbi:MAG: HEAT repeat domain-containing protein [Cyanobacteria bacterium]|nr:HEAT repeat domain-containing protein [Cyanobacteriota bacterium]